MIAMADPREVQIDKISKGCTTDQWQYLSPAITPLISVLSRLNRHLAIYTESAHQGSIS